MQVYVWTSLGAALCLALSALVGKVMLRYRVCNAGLVTWGQGVSISLISLAACAALRIPFPADDILTVVSFAAVLLIATWLLNQALQEGDASTVVPLLGIKIPVASVMAWALLGESVSTVVWVAVGLSAVAVAFFGLGRQAKAQGGHGRHPGIAIAFAVATVVLFSVADIMAKLSSSGLSPRDLVLWSNVFWGPVSVLALSAREYRKYKVGKVDVAIFFLSGILVTVAMLLLYYSFKLADSVILPNVLLGTRGVFALVSAFVLSKFMKVPMEKQSRAVYIFRAAGTLLLLAALVIVYLGS